MPYIKKESRKIYDEAIDKLITLFIENNFSAGDLNYCISRIFWTLFERKKKYETANTLIGVLENIKLELYRREIAPYENLKQLENGDII